MSNLSPENQYLQAIHENDTDPYQHPELIIKPLKDAILQIQRDLIHLQSATKQSRLQELQKLNNISSLTHQLYNMLQRDLGE